MYILEDNTTLTIMKLYFKITTLQLNFAIIMWVIIHM